MSSFERSAYGESSSQSASAAGGGVRLAGPGNPQPAFLIEPVRAPIFGMPPGAYLSYLNDHDAYVKYVRQARLEFVVTKTREKEDRQSAKQAASDWGTASKPSRVNSKSNKKPTSSKKRRLQAKAEKVKQLCDVAKMDLEYKQVQAKLKKLSATTKSKVAAEPKASKPKAKLPKKEKTNGESKKVKTTEQVILPGETSTKVARGENPSKPKRPVSKPASVAAPASEEDSDSESEEGSTTTAKSYVVDSSPLLSQAVPMTERSSVEVGSDSGEESESTERGEYSDNESEHDSEKSHSGYGDLGGASLADASLDSRSITRGLVETDGWAKSLEDKANRLMDLLDMVDENSDPRFQAKFHEVHDLYNAQPYAVKLKVERLVVKIGKVPPGSRQLCNCAPYWHSVLKGSYPALYQRYQNSADQVESIQDEV